MPELGFAYAERTDAAVLWLVASTPDRHGRFKVGSAQQVYVKWSDCQEEMLDAKGNKISVDATAVVGQDIPVGSRLYKGMLSDLAGTSENIGYLPRVMEVKAYCKITDLRGRDAVRKIGMVMYNSTGS